MNYTVFVSDEVIEFAAGLCQEPDGTTFHFGSAAEAAEFATSMFLNHDKEVAIIIEEEK